MSNFKELANLIYTNIIKDVRYKEHDNLVIAGCNASGKTTIIKSILKRALKEYPDDFYYIDPKNRSLVDQLINTQQYSNYEVHEILTERLERGNYTNKDAFVPGFSGGTVTYSELYCHYKDYLNLFEEILGLRFEFIPPTGAGANPIAVGGKSAFKINEEYDIFSLANSEAAKARIIMEVKFACQKNCKVVIIDEFDDHLDTENMTQFYELLSHKFPDIKYVLAIHNYEPLVNMAGVDALVFDGDNDWRLVDCDNITKLGEVDRLRSKFLGTEKQFEKRLADCVSSWLKNSSLSSDQISFLTSLKREELLNRERILYDYLMEKRVQNES